MLFISKNEQDTFNLAKKIAKNLKGGETIALIGELGSGKTIFSSGIAKSIGIQEYVSSPTFNILKLYNIPAPKNKPSGQTTANQLCHIDAYRLKKSSELRELGITDYFNDPNTITLIEWADKIQEILPKNTIVITFKTGKKETERFITIT